MRAWTEAFGPVAVPTSDLKDSRIPVCLSPLVHLQPVDANALGLEKSSVLSAVVADVVERQEDQTRFAAATTCRDTIRVVAKNLLANLDGGTLLRSVHVLPWFVLGLLPARDALLASVKSVRLAVGDLVELGQRLQAITPLAALLASRVVRPCTHGKTVARAATYCNSRTRMGRPCAILN